MTNSLLTEGINWYGPMNPYYGYGRVNMEYSVALERLTGIVNIPWERRTEQSEVWVDMTEEQRALHKKPPVKSQLGIIKSIPTLFHMNKSPFKIGYTMVENTRMGEGWTEVCNRMNAMFVPTEFVKQVFEESGVKIPIMVVRQGIDTKRFPYIDRPLHREPYTFGIISFMDDRKNWKDLYSAFSSEFGPEENVRLIIKNANPTWGAIVPKDPRVKIVHQQLTFSQLTKFYETLDCFVFPSHAEGSGLPPREAMATGLPTILTNFSGLTEVCGVKYNYPIDPVAIDCPDERGDPSQPGFWARLDVAEIMYWMRYVYEHQEEAKEKGRIASEFIHREFNWDRCAQIMWEHLKNL